jgi:hypothetical protein
MRRHASGIGCGARGRGMNATPQAPGRRRGTRKQVYAVCANANCFAGGTTPPARSWLTAGRQACPRLERCGDPKGAGTSEPEAGRNGASESAARRRQEYGRSRATNRHRLLPDGEIHIS